MALFGKLFGGTAKSSPEALLAALQDAAQKKDFKEMAKKYYDLAEAYSAQADSVSAKEKALLYYSRFDTLVSSRDDLCEKIPEKMQDHASERIEELQEDDSLYCNRMREKVDEMKDSLIGISRVQWSLLTLARFGGLFKRLAPLPGFELLADFERVLDIIGETTYRPLTEEESAFLLQFVSAFYTFTDSPALADITNRIPISGRADFEAYDLVGQETLLNMYGFLDDLLSLEDMCNVPTDFTTDFISNALLADYYIRTDAGDLASLAPIQEEEARIMSDYEFVKDFPSEEEFKKRFSAYRELFL